MISHEVVRRLRGSRDWAAVEKHIRDAVASLDTVADIKGNADAMALEVIARQHAAVKLIEILRPFTDFQDKSDVAEAANERAEDTGLDYPQDGEK